MNLIYTRVDFVNQPRVAGVDSKAKEMVMLADTLGQSLLFGSSLHIGAENDEERASKAENPNHRGDQTRRNLIEVVGRILLRPKKKLPPGPLALPIIGHLHLLKNPLHKSLESLVAQYGPIMYLKFGSRPALVVSSSSAIEECFTKNDIIFANRPPSMSGDILTYSFNRFVWASYGHNWRTLRRIAVTKRILLRSLKNLPPGPLSLPIIGHLHLLKNPLYKSLESLSSQYGPIMFLKFGSRSTLVVSSPSAIEESFTKNDIIFANRPLTMAADILTYNSTVFVWASYGHNWRTLRRIAVTEFLSSSSVPKSASIRDEEVSCLVRRLFKRCSGGGKQKVDLNLLISVLTKNVMMKLATGKWYVEEEHANTEVEKQLFQEFKQLFSASLGMNICDFIPVFRLIGYKGIETSMKKIDGEKRCLLAKFG
ncbi:hypothetical protein Tsubulata_047300 [Turnera subulata]|uniref:Cytochrome P450 n=1 Tax=Turnera subulata TaxID=218843 RepID=A0A9Q0J3K8_9ROSI|nr:hypothetical protein Tsubulata_047300 [Turnera subulata]